MSNYKQLTDQERHLIEYLHNNENRSICYIAKELKRNKSTVSRELKRNTINQEYNSEAALFNAKTRQLIKHLETSQFYKEFLVYFYQNYDKKYFGVEVCVFSANQIGIKVPTARTVYNWINKEIIDFDCCQLLRSRQKFRIKATKSTFLSHIPKDIIPITFRPKDINKRKETGHFEIDLVISSKNRRSGILTLVDRKSRKGYVTKIFNKKMQHINDKLEEIISKYQLKIKSITKDNGMEFNALVNLKEKYHFQLYTCNPYASCEKGTNENFNGLIRRTYPKGTNFLNVSEDELQLVIDQINKMPRKMFGFKNANQICETNFY